MSSLYIHIHIHVHIHIQIHIHKGPQAKKLHVQRLRNREVVQKLQTKIKEKLGSPAALTEDPLQQWEQLKLALQEASVEAIGFVTRKHRGWFDESDSEIQQTRVISSSLLVLAIVLRRLLIGKPAAPSNTDCAP